MSPLGKTKISELSKWMGYIKKSFFPLYIILSFLFILYSVYSYFQIAIYQVGVQDGYNRAALDISNQSLTQQGCVNGVSLPTVDGKGTLIINSVCIPQQWIEETRVWE